MKPGDPVVYLAHPDLYGEMEVLKVRSKGRVTCIVDPDSKFPTFAVFGVDEVESPVVAAASRP